MTYRTKSGHTITEDMIEELAEAAERGEHQGRPGKVNAAPQGRLSLCDEEPATKACS